MSNFREKPHQKNSEPLPKEQILGLGGGEKRGEKIFVKVNYHEIGWITLETKVRNNFRSQTQGTAHPEGYLWLNSEVYKSEEFRYDIATAKCALPVYWVYGGRIYHNWLYYPALVFQPPCRSDQEIQLANDARKDAARQLLNRALERHPGCVGTVAELLAEDRWLGKIAPGEDSTAKRVL